VNDLGNLGAPARTSQKPMSWF